MFWSIVFSFFRSLKFEQNSFMLSSKVLIYIPCVPRTWAGRLWLLTLVRFHWDVFPTIRAAPSGSWSRPDLSRRRLKTASGSGSSPWRTRGGPRSSGWGRRPPPRSTGWGSRPSERETRPGSTTRRPDRTRREEQCPTSNASGGSNDD